MPKAGLLEEVAARDGAQSRRWWLSRTGHLVFVTVSSRFSSTLATIVHAASVGGVAAGRAAPDDLGCGARARRA